MNQLVVILVVYGIAFMQERTDAGLVLRQEGHYEENEIGAPINETTFDECRALCYQHESCHDFSWHVGSRMCYLNSSEADDVATRSSAATRRRLGKRDKEKRCYSLINDLG